VYAAIEQARAAPDRLERRRELSWADELERIIRGNEIHVVFQPIVEIQSQSVLGYEAWARGPLDSLFESPRAMFAFSERVGAGERLDGLCCTRALETFAGAVGEGKLFVNVLARSCDDLDEPEAGLCRAVDRAALEPSDVVLEISERGAGADEAALCGRIERARRAGFSIAIDDVGTGRLALETLERIRPDYLKLDVSLVRRIEGNLIQQEVLRTLVDLARRIGAAVVGEGVETAEEARTLAAGGARYAQGFYWAQPASAEHVRVKRA
jgi:EAL domain-containing protein (putative c-di-GMP-specific phosphodiesterase class I)